MGIPHFGRTQPARTGCCSAIRCRTCDAPRRFEAWQDPSTWEVLKPQESLSPAKDGKPVKPHSGSIAWNDFRKRWVTVFMESFGKPSVFGELWYAEADAPTGPWGKAVKVLTHENYTFYNPRLHPEFTPTNSPILHFRRHLHDGVRGQAGAHAALRLQPDALSPRFGRCGAETGPRKTSAVNVRSRSECEAHLRVQASITTHPFA